MSNTITYVKCFEPISRKPYYYNCITHEAQWSVPKGAEAKNEDIDLPKEDLTVCNYVGNEEFKLPFSSLLL